MTRTSLAGKTSKKVIVLAGRLANVGV